MMDGVRRDLTIGHRLGESQSTLASPAGPYVPYAYRSIWRTQSYAARILARGHDSLHRKAHVYFDFGNVLIFLLFAVLFVAVTLFLSRIIRPSEPSEEKASTYECGELPFGGSWIQFNLRFYVIALIFLIFEVEVVFLFPWAVVLTKIGMFALVEMLFFLGILLVGLAYVWRKKDLSWVMIPEARLAEPVRRSPRRENVEAPEGVIKHEAEPTIHA